MVRHDRAPAHHPIKRDGLYKLKFVVKDFPDPQNGEHTKEETVNLVVDNHIPRIEKIEVLRYGRSSSGWDYPPRYSNYGEEPDNLYQSIINPLKYSYPGEYILRSKDKTKIRIYFTEAMTYEDENGDIAHTQNGDRHPGIHFYDQTREVYVPAKDREEFQDIQPHSPEWFSSTDDGYYDIWEAELDRDPYKVGGYTTRSNPEIFERDRRYIF